MLSSEQIRQLCPAECPILHELARRRRQLSVDLLLHQDSMSKSERQAVWQKADWDDQDARELARTCLKRTFEGFGHWPHCTSFPDK